MLPYWADAAESSLKALLGLIPSVLQDASKLHSQYAGLHALVVPKLQKGTAWTRGINSRSVAPLIRAHQPTTAAASLRADVAAPPQTQRKSGTHMGRSAKVARIGNFATHKKNVQKRSLVVEKRPKKSRQTYATSKAPARAPKKAVRDAPKKK